MTNCSNLQYQCFTNHYQSDPLLEKTSLPMIANPLVASILPAINLQMTLGNLSTAANGLPLVPISNDIRELQATVHHMRVWRSKEPWKKWPKNNSFCWFAMVTSCVSSVVLKDGGSSQRYSFKRNSKVYEKLSEVFFCKKLQVIWNLSKIERYILPKS